MPPMSVKREIECLKRLEELSSAYEALLQFLSQERLIEALELKEMRASPETAKLLQQKLSLLAKGGQLQLLTYEWALLPTELIKLTLVTQNNIKEITAEL